MAQYAASLVVLGLGKMGTAMALRLRDGGKSLSVWNRTASKAALLQGDGCSAAESARDAVRQSAPDSAVLIVMSNTAACLEVINEVKDELRGRTVVNMTSGSPDDGRQIASELAGPHLRVRAYLDGAYCGPPAKARAGAGTLFVSSSQIDEVERLRPTLSMLGEVAMCGPVGASRAIDYAVVDLALVCYASFLSNVEMLEREGVDRAQLYEQMGKRLATVPGAVQVLHNRLADRSDAAYHASPIVTQETLHDFWSSRLAYFDAHSIPADFPRYMASLSERAAGGPHGAHWATDVTRMQELMRPPPAQ